MWKLKRRFSSIAREWGASMTLGYDIEGAANGTPRATETQPLLRQNGVNGGPYGGEPRRTTARSHSRTLSRASVHVPVALSDGLTKYVYEKAKTVLKSNYVNVLLVFVPIGVTAGELGWSSTAVFALNFMAIIPLAALLSFATEELALKVGETIGGLMNATFGNAVELIVSIVALNKGEIRIVQASMLGSILSNILLVLGMCFFFGGLKYHEQSFNSKVASTMSSLMAVATSSLIIPAALYATIEDKGKPSFDLILQLSRGTSMVILCLYIMYLFFQLKTHTDLFQAEVDEDEEEGSCNIQEPVLNVIEAGVVLVLVTVLVAVCAEYLVGSIEGIVESSGISKTFIGLILIPIVGNAAEHVTAIVVAMKNKMDLAIGVAIGSSMQIALLVTPFLVILGWIIGQPMSLYFQTFETVVFFVSTYLTYYVVQDGKSNYLEGAMLLGIYIIIALSFYVYPDSAGRQPGTPS